MRLVENLSQQQNALQRKKESLYGQNTINGSLIGNSFYEPEAKPYEDITDVRVIAKMQEESKTTTRFEPSFQIIQNILLTARPTQKHN